MSTDISTRIRGVTVKCGFTHTAKEISIGWKSLDGDTIIPIKSKGSAWSDTVVVNFVNEIYLLIDGEKSKPLHFTLAGCDNACYVIKSISHELNVASEQRPKLTFHLTSWENEQGRSKGPNQVQKESTVVVKCDFKHPAKAISILWDGEEHSIKNPDGAWVGSFDISVGPKGKEILLLIDGKASKGFQIAHFIPTYTIESISYRIIASLEKQTPGSENSAVPLQHQDENHEPVGVTTAPRVG